VNISVRLFLGYFLIVGVAAWFVLNIFSQEVKPGVRQGMEETLVDTANTLAELAGPDMASGHIANGAFATAVAAAAKRLPQASISGVDKQSVDLRIYVADTKGTVVYDSEGKAVGADYANWRDVARALRGEYGARSTRDDPEDEETSAMYVAAPVRGRDGRLLGVLTVSKPVSSVTPYAQRAVRRIKRGGAVLLAVSALIGLGFTLWLTWSLTRLRNYAHGLANGEKLPAPTSGGRQLSELASALQTMRERLDGKQYVEQYAQTLTHEMKSPLAAIRGAAELLQDNPPEADRARFIANIRQQSERLQTVIDRLLELVRLEHLQRPEKQQRVRLRELAEEVASTCATRLAARGLTLAVSGPASAEVLGDPFLLRQALGNLVENAIDFSAPGGKIKIDVEQRGGQWNLSVRDHGSGIPDYALPRLFERFFSLPRPDGGQRGTGLGLVLVAEIAKLHRGSTVLSNHGEGGALACLSLPAA